MSTYLLPFDLIMIRLKIGFVPSLMKICMANSYIGGASLTKLRR